MTCDYKIYAHERSLEGEYDNYILDWSKRNSSRSCNEITSIRIFDVSVNAVIVVLSGCDKFCTHLKKQRKKIFE